PYAKKTGYEFKFDFDFDFPLSLAADTTRSYGSARPCARRCLRLLPKLFGGALRTPLQGHLQKVWFLPQLFRLLLKERRRYWLSRVTGAQRPFELELESELELYQLLHAAGSCGRFCPVISRRAWKTHVRVSGSRDASSAKS